MEERSAEVKNFYEIRNVVLNMLKKRGYEVPEGSFDMSYDDFRLLYEKNRHHIYFPEMKLLDSDEIGVLAYFEPSDDFTKSNFEDRVAQLMNEYNEPKKIFFIMKTSSKKKKINLFVLSAIREDEKYKNIEILKNIYPFSIFKSHILPSFRKLDEKEKENVIKYFKTKEELLPKMLSTDPVAQQYGCKQGDILQVIRYGGKEIVFRQIIDKV